MHTSYLSLGSNLGDRFKNIERALGFMKEQGIQVLKSSSCYETEPWGFVADEPFINQVVMVASPHNYRDLFQVLRRVEHQLGRRRTRKGGYQSRSIDIDILFFDHVVVQTRSLQIPHPKIAERRFILEPLATISPEFLHPLLQKTVSELLTECRDAGSVNKIETASPEVHT